MVLDGRWVSLLGPLLMQAGCRGAEDAPADPPVGSEETSSSATVPVTWTADQCGYVDPDFESAPTGSQDWPTIPGCPVVAEEGWHLFEGGAPNPEKVICQSAWTWDEARAAGVLAALDIPDDLGPDLEFLLSCEEVPHGEPTWSGLSTYWVGYGDPESTSSRQGYVWWFADQEGAVRSAMLESAYGVVNCGDRALNGMVVLGEPLFTPDARLFACQPP